MLSMPKRSCNVQVQAGTRVAVSMYETKRINKLYRVMPFYRKMNQILTKGICNQRMVYMFQDSSLTLS